MITRRIVEEIITESLRRITGSNAPLLFNASLEFLGIEDLIVSRHFKELLINISARTLLETVPSIQEDQLGAIRIELKQNLNIHPKMELAEVARSILFILEKFLTTEFATTDLPGDSTKLGDPN